jgi:predicted transcriptional regulator
MEAPPEHLPSNRVLELVSDNQNLQVLEAVTKALGSDTRLEILRFLGTHTCSLMEISDALKLPQSTATMHINVLEKAGLIKTDLMPAKRGLQKVCARVYDRIIVQLPAEKPQQQTTIEVSMPLGAYVEARVVPTCGLAGELGIIGHMDEPGTFFEPERIYTQLLWFHHGYIEYRFPNRMPPDAALENIEVSFEVCSEAPLHHSDWPSDITVSINGVEIGTWTSPADFGGQRGVLTPEWWDNNNSQYGLLKVWRVTPRGSYVDGVRVSDVNLTALHLRTGQPISVTIAVKENAHNVGGINIFGSKFGNYPQDIVLKQNFRRDETKGR